MTELEFRLLGPLEVARAGEPVVLGGQLRRGVLAMLVLDRGRVVSTDRLIAGVWGEAPPHTALTALHGHISNLRRALGDVIKTRAPGYVLDAPHATVDVEVLETCLDEGRAALASDDADAATRALEQAQELWRGAPLEDIADLPFARDALPVLEELGLTVREVRVDAELAAGRSEEVVPELRALVAQNPLRERPRAQLMLALFRAGRQTEALATYDDVRRALSEQLGIEPGEPLRRLHESILREDSSLGGTGRAIRTSTPARRTAPEMPNRVRRKGLAIAVAVGLGAAGVLAVALASRGGSSSESPQLRGAGIVRVDPSDLGVDAAIALDGTPTSVTAAGDVAWAIDADGQTIAEVSGDERVHTFATGATPTDLAAGDSGLWITQGGSNASAAPATRTTGLANVAPGASRVARTVSLPGGGAGSGVPASRIAVTRNAVWVIAQDGRVVRVDPTRGRVVRVLDLRAQALAAEPERVWILSSDRTLLAVDEAAGAAGVPIDAPAGAGASLAVGGGGLWLLDPADGVVTRVDPGASEPPRTARVGAGAGPVTYGHGSAWVVDGPRKRVLRLDGRTAAITGEVRPGGTPRDVAASERGIWITTGPLTDAAVAAGCGPVESGGRRPDALVVVDLPLHGAPRRPTDAMAAAVGYVVSRRRFRAGKLQVGYRVCDVSTAQLGEVDLEKCAATARAYASDPRVVIEVGPYTSSCARRQLPIAAAARRGPLAMISPTNSLPALTRDPRATGPRFYARIVARDDDQAGVMAAELRRRGDRRVFVLDDSAGSPTYGLDVASFFAAAARREGLTVAGRASWAGRDPTTVARRVARTRPDAIYLSGVDGGQAGRLIRALRLAAPRATIGVPDLLTPVARLFDTAGDSARDVLLTASALPVTAMPQRGRDLAAALARDQGADSVHPYVVYAAQAAEAALDAIARSDGSRASVARALLATRLADGSIGPVAFDSNGDLASAPVALFRLARGGGSHAVAATEGAELIAVRR